MAQDASSVPEEHVQK